MKATLFSRMSPNKGQSEGNRGSSLAEVQKLARTQNAGGSMASTSATGAGSPKNGANAGTVTMVATRSPFREAMAKGVLSGTGMLTF